MKRKQELLQCLRQAEQCMSGEGLGKQLGVSRMSVCKLVRALKEDGYDIETVPNRGYILHPGGDVLETEEVAAHLQTRWMGHELEVVDSLTSTNDYLMQLPSEQLTHGRTVLARRQTAGRGRHGSAFTSPLEKGIYMSFCLCPNVPLEDVKLLSLIAGLTVCRLVRGLGVSDACIHYPANVWVGDKKLCGIRSEVMAEAETMQVERCIIGIGLYVNADAQDWPDGYAGTSLRQETGEIHQRSQLAAEILRQYEESYEQLLQHGSAALCREYTKYLAEMGQTLHTSRHGAVNICNVDVHGNLVGRDSRRRVVRLRMDDVEQGGV